MKQNASGTGVVRMQQQQRAIMHTDALVCRELLQAFQIVPPASGKIVDTNDTIRPELGA